MRRHFGIVFIHKEELRLDPASDFLFASVAKSFISYSTSSTEHSGIVVKDASNSSSSLPFDTAFMLQQS